MLIEYLKIFTPDIFLYTGVRERINTKGKKTSRGEIARLPEGIL
jgi:hypothetical protein